MASRLLGQLVKEQSRKIGTAARAAQGAPPAPQLSAIQAFQQAIQPRPATGGVKPAAPRIPTRAAAPVQSPGPAFQLPPRPVISPAALKQVARQTPAPVMDSAVDQLANAFGYQQQEPEPEDDTSWGVYQLPDGTMVAMPSAWAPGLPEGSNQHGENITDPDAIERARESDIAYLNQSEDVQSQIAVPGENTVANNGENWLWIGDDQARMAQEQQQEAAAARYVTGEGADRLKRLRTPVSIQSDLLRQQMEEANQQQAASYIKAVTTPGISMASDQARQQDEQEQQQQAARYINAITKPGVSIASDQARQQQEAQTQEQAARAMNAREVANGGKNWLWMGEDIARMQAEQQEQEGASVQAMQEAAANLVEIDGRLYPEGTESPDQYEYNRGGDHNLPPPPAGYIWVYDIQDPSQPYLAQGTTPPPGTVALPLTPSEDDQGGVFPDVTELPEEIQAKWNKDWEPIASAIVASIKENPPTSPADFEALAPIWKEALKLVPTLIPDAVEGVAGDAIKAVIREGGETWDRARAGEFGAAVENATDAIDTAIHYPIPGSQYVIPGDGQFSLIEAIGTALSKPQQYSVEQGIDAWYEEASGNPVDMDRSGGIVPTGDLAALFAENVWKLSSFPDWLEDNEAAAMQVYENGVDTNGDGTVDLTGADAVVWLYEEQAGAWENFVFQLVTDPLTWLPIVGAGSKAVKGVGTAIRMGERAGRLRRGTGAVIEALGETGYKASRIAEEASDLGAGVALEGLGKLARRTGITAPKRTAAAEAEYATAESMQGNILRRQRRDNATAVAPGGTPANPTPSPGATPPGGTTVVTPPPGFTPTPPPGATPPGGTSVVTPPPGFTPGSTVPPGGTTTPPPGGTTTPPQGTPGTPPQPIVVDEINDLPARWIPSPDPARGTRAIDVTYQRVGERQWAPVRDEMADTWRASEASLRSQGSGIAKTEMAIESSAVARDTLDSMSRHGIDAGAEWSYNDASAAENLYYRAVEEVIRKPWSETAAQRSFLTTIGPSGWAPTGREFKGTNPFYRTDLLPDNPNPREVVKANNYVNLMEQHLLWHPDALNDPSFREAWQAAVDLDAQLRASGLRTVVGDGIYKNAGRPLADYAASQRAGVTVTRGADAAIDTSGPTGQGRLPTKRKMAPRRKVAADRPDAPDIDMVEEYYANSAWDREGPSARRREYVLENGEARVFTREVPFDEVPEVYSKGSNRLQQRQQWVYAEMEPGTGGAVVAHTYARNEDYAIRQLFTHGQQAGLFSRFPPVPDDELGNIVPDAPQKYDVPLSELDESPGAAPVTAPEETPAAPEAEATEPPKGKGLSFRSDEVTTMPGGEEVRIIERNDGSKVWAFENRRVVQDRDGTITIEMDRASPNSDLSFGTYAPSDAKRFVVGWSGSLDDALVHRQPSAENFLPLRPEQRPTTSTAATAEPEAVGVTAERVTPDDTVASVDDYPGTGREDYLEGTVNEPSTPPTEPVSTTPEPATEPTDQPATPDEAATGDRPGDEGVVSDAGEPATTVPSSGDVAADGRLEAVGDTYNIDPEDLNFDEGEFQSRQSTNMQWVDTLAATWNDRRAGPINVVETSPGQYTVVSGHHRAMAAIKAKRAGKVDRVRIRVLKGESVEEAIEEGVIDSVESNAAGNLKPSPLDDARALALLRDRGVTPQRGKIGPFTRERVRRIDQVAKLPDSVHQGIEGNWQGIPHDIEENPIPTGVRDPLAMTERKGAALARLIDEGMYDEAGIDSFYRDTLMQPDMRMTDAEFESFIDLMLGQKDMLTQLRATQDSLFDMTGISNEGYDPITKLLREQAKLEAASKRNATVLTAASNKTGNQGVRVELKKEAAEVKAGRTGIEDALREAIATEKRNLSNYSRTTEGKLKVKTSAGDQYVMDVGVAPSLRTDAPGSGEALTTDDLLGAPEPTAAEIRARELDAGQTDMFGNAVEPRTAAAAVDAAESDVAIQKRKRDTNTSANNGQAVIPPEAVRIETEVPETTTKKDPTGKVDMDVVVADADAITVAEVNPKTVTFTKGDRTVTIHAPRGNPDNATWHVLDEGAEVGKPRTYGERRPKTLTREEATRIARERLGETTTPGFQPANMRILPWRARATTIAHGPIPPARTNVVDIDTGTHYWGTLRRVLDTTEYETLTRHPFTNGDTLMDRIDGHYNFISAKNPRMWPEDVEKLAAMEALDEYREHLLQNVYRGSALTRGAKATYQAMPAPVKAILDKAGNVLKSMIRGLDTSNQFYRERMLFGHLKGPSYVMTQALGNFSMLSLGGEWRTLFRYANMRDGWNEARRALRDNIAVASRTRGLSELERATKMFEADPGISQNAKIANRLGMRRGREEFNTYQGQSGNISDPLLTTKALRAVNKHLGGLGKLAGSRAYAIQGAMWDGAMREALAASESLRGLRDIIPDYRNQSIGRMMDWGMTKDAATRAWDDFVDAHPTGQWNMDEVIDHFSNHVTPGQAQRLGRDWQKAMYDLETRVDNRLKKVTFAGDETNADVVLKRLFIFHHFMSRQSWFLATQAAHHPFLINTYFNLQEELEKLSEGWPEYMQNWVALMPFMGITVLLNPVSLMASFITFADQGQTWMPDQVTQIGEWALAINDKIGINPLIMQALNLSGVMGDAPAPDLFAIWREDRAITLALNVARYFGMGDNPAPIGSWYDQTMMDLRETLSGWNPWLDDPVLARDVDDDIARDVQIILVDEAMRRGLDPESAEVREAMMDPESDLYQAALKRYLLGEATTVATDVALGPFRPRVAQTNAEGYPIYPNLTKGQKAVANVTDHRAQELENKRDEYYDIGEERDHNLADVWSDIAYGTVVYGMVIDGRYYSPSDIAKMSEDERKELANAALNQFGYLDDVHSFWAERDAWLQDPENKAYAQYDTWSNDVRDYEGGVDGYWQELIAENPNAARYYETVQRMTLSPQDREKRLTSMGAFMAMMGIQPDAFAPNPTVTDIYGDGVYDPANIGNQNAQPQEARPPSEFEEEARSAPEFYQDMQEWDSAVDEKQAELGYPDVPFNQLTGKARKNVEESLEAEGVYEPDPPDAVEQYIEWASAQPAGADTSIDAFLRADQAAYQARSGQRLAESVDAPPIRSSGESDFWADLLSILEEHDYNRYP